MGGWAGGRAGGRAGEPAVAGGRAEKQRTEGRIERQKYRFMDNESCLLFI